MRNPRLKAGSVGSNIIARWGIRAGMLVIVTLAVLPPTVGLAAVGDITMVAGGFTGDEGPATSAKLALPTGVAVDATGNLFISHTSNNLVRKVAAAAGIITTVAGTRAFDFSGDWGPTLADVDNFGVSVSSIGDLNGDGVEDIAVGAFLDDTGGTDRGAVYILFMNVNGTVSSSSKIASGTNGGPTLADGDHFGLKVTGIGDLNGDGVGDMAVGVESDSTEGEGRGAVYVLFMNANGTVSSSVKIASGTNGGPTLADSDAFGAGVSSMGDLNGDGVKDIAVGAQSDSTGGTSRGAVHLLLMNANGTVSSSFVKIASGTNGGPTLANFDSFGNGVSSIGDLNGDGVEDIAVGAFQDDTGGKDRGAVYVLFMNASGTVSSSVKIASGTNGGPTLADDDAFGVKVSSIGDLNGDGVEDIAVGAYNDNTGGPDRGAVYVLFMNANGTVSSSVKIASGTNGGPTLADGDAFGVDVSPIGDLNGDGVEDIAVGAHNDDTGGENRGAVYILFMNANGTVSSSVKIASGTNGDPATAATLDTLEGVAVGIAGNLFIADKNNYRVRTVQRVASSS